MVAGRVGQPPALAVANLHHGPGAGRDDGRAHRHRDIHRITAARRVVTEVAAGALGDPERSSLPRQGVGRAIDDTRLIRLRREDQRIAERVLEHDRPARLTLAQRGDAYPAVGRHRLADHAVADARHVDHARQAQRHLHRYLQGIADIHGLAAAGTVDEQPYRARFVGCFRLLAGGEAGSQRSQPDQQQKGIDERSQREHDV